MVERVQEGNLEISIRLVTLDIQDGQLRLDGRQEERERTRTWHELLTIYCSPLAASS
jgi:hypothetical protein